MRPQSRNAQQTIARLAAPQQGNVTRRQLLDAGLSEQQIKRRVRNGLLLPRYPGVYRVGHAAPSVHADYMAAVLACGDAATLIGMAAAYLLSIVTGKPPPPEVASPTEHKIPRLTSRRRRIDRRDRWTVRGIPVASPAYVLVDLAAHLTERQLSLAAHRAGTRHGTTPGQVKAVLARRGNAKGAANMREVTGVRVPVSLSQLERAFIALLRKHGLPLPRTNRKIGSHRVDCHWPEYGLTVELVSYLFHNTRWSWEQDHERRREARARGEGHLQYTWRDVVEVPGPTVAELRTLIDRPGPGRIIG